MKLSEVLSRFYVLPFGQSEIVGFSGIEEGDEDDSGLILVTWTDSDDYVRYEQVFRDQDIALGGNTVQGMFVVKTVGGEVVSFIALDGVDLTRVSS